jgi:hypothetical protein
MNAVSQSRIKVKLGIATDDDYIAVIEEALASTPWFIEDLTGIFLVKRGMGMSGKDALISAISAFGIAFGIEGLTHDNPQV